jgi:hypothetical protein
MGSHTDDLLLQSLLHGGVWQVSLNILLPNVASCADLGRCSIRCCWFPSRGVCWYPMRWFVSCFWSKHGVRSIRDDEAQKSYGAAAQLCADCPPVRLDKLYGGVDFLVIRIALNSWEYRVREALYDIIDGGVLHLDVLRGPKCLFLLLMRKRFWTRVPKKTLVLSEGYSLG